MSQAQQETIEPTPPVSVRGLVSAEELRRWRKPNTARALLDVSLIWVQIVAGIALYVLFPNPLTFVVAFALVAGGQHCLHLASHEFAHYSILPDDRKRNDWIGTWLFAAPVGLPFAIYRHRHFYHHRMYSTDRDTKTNYRFDWRGWGLARQVVRSLSGYEYADHVLSVVRGQGEGAEVAPGGPNPVASLPPLVISQLVLIAAFATVDVFLYLWLWILPLITLCYFFNKVRATKEHQPLDSDGGVDPDGPYFKGTAGPFVRSVHASWPERLFLCKINFCYHAEHHIWPQVSYQYLPEIHRRMVAGGWFDDPRFGHEATYTSTIRKLFRPEEAR
ncbi:MAG: hypothetical protein HKP30_02795 [Myxococcales bacterium]|nr:hypothetical protein [Myxococcales bacterium]